MSEPTTALVSVIANVVTVHTFSPHILSSLFYNTYLLLECKIQSPSYPHRFIPLYLLVPDKEVYCIPYATNYKQWVAAGFNSILDQFL